jgi:MOSC domain-containing protein YiiM
VVAIHIATREGGAMEQRDAVQAIAGQGLEGDRYYDGTGTFSAREGPARQLTLIEAESIEAIEREQGIVLGPGESRRNVTTRGAPLNHFVGREFRVGDVLLRGIKLCEPCGYLQRTLGIDHLVQALAHRCGLNAEILTSGTLSIGDPVEPTRDREP